ncbi:hypothetical protein SADUNF_Sadunf17G0100000 [Salix dunnii]|uniref:TIR domain-containing protein n=1 Tax=Salix dunnii TaxID=1413687 RepID=A0A835J5I3_9ROSI|nr:hypothetical protein SADUNF_Sadunf17G0100000 [Salix dunnii]
MELHLALGLNESESIQTIVEHIFYKLSITMPTISKNLVGVDSRLEVLNGYIGEEVGEAIFIGGKEKQEVVFLDMPRITETQWNMETFSKMSKLRLLKINNVQLSEGPQDLSNMLRFLEWHFYPSKSLPACLQVDELVELHMPNSSIEQLWYGPKTGITKLSSSIHQLIGLGLLSMNNCKNLTRIPRNIGCLKSLKKLDLSGCFELKYIPRNLGEVETLEEFDLSGTSIKDLPASISLLKNLKVLSLDGCKRIVMLPSLLGLCSLEVLGLRDCHLREEALLQDICWLSSLISLDLSQNDFVSLPISINKLSRLEMLVLEDCRMLESLPMVPSKVQTVNLNGCIRPKEIPDPINLSSSKGSEFLCLNCWELYKHNDQDNTRFTMLERYLQGLSNPRPRFSIVVPGNEIPGWFNHQKKGSSISVEMHSWSMGFVACVAFSASGESPSLFCHFKSNGRENYPSLMGISCNTIQVLSDHIWLFYLSFNYLKELIEWHHESFRNIELSFHSSEQVEVKNCGLFLLYSLHSPPSSQFFLIHVCDSADNNEMMHLPIIRGTDTSNAFTHLTTPTVRGTIPDDKKLEKVMAIRSRLLKAIEESGMSIVIFARDCASLTWCFDELVKMVRFMDEMRPSTVFPVSYDVKQSMIDDQTGWYTIVFDKDEENFKDEVKIKRWMNILTGVENDDKSGSESFKSTEAPPEIWWPDQNVVRMGQLNGQKRSSPIPLQRSRQIPRQRQRFQQLQNLDPLLQQLRQQPYIHKFLCFRVRNESESIKIIVEYILYKLSLTMPTINKNLVGIDSHLEVLNDYIGEEVCQPIFIGGKEKIEAIFLDMPGITEAQWNMEVLSKMSKLRLLKINNVQLSKGPEDLSNVNELVELHMPNSNIEQLWYGHKHLIGLGLLSMNNCDNLTRIPEGIGCLKSLKKLDLSGCCRLKYIPENFGEARSLEEFDLSGTSIEKLPASISLLKNLKVLSLDGCKRIAVLPSLSGLCSLEVLGLRACHLREGALPEDIGGLSSLMSLDLSWNNFVSLPKSIYKLSRLEILVLEGCRMLKSLPEVPSKVQIVNLNGCISLREIPDLIMLSSSKRLEFSCLNCWELYNHNGKDKMGFDMLARYLQRLSNPRPGFGIIVPGYEIAGCFNNQKKGSSISMEVHSWSMGFVACVAFSAFGENPSLFCHFKANGREDYPSPMGISCSSIQVLSDHLWLFYLSFDCLKELKEWQHESFSNIELSFHSSEQVKVKNCGVFLLYSLHTPQSSQSSSSCNYEMKLFHLMRDADTSNGFTHLSTTLVLRGIVLDDKEPEKVMFTRIER